MRVRPAMQTTRPQQEQSSGPAAPANPGAGAAGGPPATHDALVQAVSRQALMASHLIRVLLRSRPSDLLFPPGAPPNLGATLALRILYDGGPRQVGDLAAQCRMSDSLMSKTLRLLEDQQLVERRVAPANRRIVWVHLTDHGRTIYEQLQVYREESLARVLAPLSSAQLENMLQAFQDLARVVGPSVAGA